MKKLLIPLLFFALTSCTDNKKIIEQARQVHSDSAKTDSINYVKLKIKDEKLTKIILDKRIYSLTELDSIFTGKK